MRDLVVQQRLASGEHPCRGLVVGQVQLDDDPALDPSRTMERRSGQARDDTPALGPEPRRNDAIQQGQLRTSGRIHVGQDPHMMPTEFVTGDLAGGQSFAADEHVRHQGQSARSVGLHVLRSPQHSRRVRHHAANVRVTRRLRSDSRRGTTGAPRRCGSACPAGRGRRSP